MCYGEGEREVCCREGCVVEMCCREGEMGCRESCRESVERVVERDVL